MSRLLWFSAHQGTKWNAWMDRVQHDFYHRAEYHALAEQQGEGIAYLAIYGNRRRFLAWPYLLLPLARVNGLELTDLCDVTSVYGYPGPVSLNSDEGSCFRKEAMCAIQELWRAQKAVTVFTRTNPLLQQPLHEDFGTLLPAGQTISIDLRIPLEESWAQIRRGHRYEIQMAQKGRLVFLHDEQWSFLNQFIVLYSEKMRQKGAQSRYLFDQVYFTKLRELSGLAACHLLVVLHRQEVAAAAIFTECRGIVQYHLSAMRDEYRRPSPVKFLLDGARVWAKTRGNSVLHLGGGHAGAADCLFQFKAGFSKRRHQFCVWRTVLDQVNYDLLADIRAQYCAKRKFASGSSWFFPVYRQPLVLAEQFSRASGCTASTLPQVCQHAWHR